MVREECINKSVSAVSAMATNSKLSLFKSDNTGTRYLWYWSVHTSHVSTTIPRNRQPSPPNVPKNGTNIIVLPDYVDMTGRGIENWLVVLMYQPPIFWNVGRPWYLTILLLDKTHVGSDCPDNGRTCTSTVVRQGCFSSIRPIMDLLQLMPPTTSL